MATRNSRSIVALVTAAWLTAGAAIAHAQIGNNVFTNRSVGGVAIDADGVVMAPSVEDDRLLDRVRRDAPLAAPADLRPLAELRAISLKEIEAVVARCERENQPIPAEVEYLGGLLRVEYVLAYPDRNDIVLAGPAEGWKIDRLGNVVGATTNRPTLLLEDLTVALRSAASDPLVPISCSIDPTSEGLSRLRSVTSRMRRIGNPNQTMRRIEDALGPQVVSVTGIPADSHFARTIVAADFRMKRIAMNFEPAPIDGMPSFLHMVKTGRRGMSNMMPRWWLAPNYEPLAKSADGLAWQLRGPGVKCMTEEDYLDADGNIQRGRKASPVAAKWAQNMTDHFSDLAQHDSAFGQLRNVMDLAVVGSLIHRQGLLQSSELAIPYLLSEARLASYPIPRSTSSKASFVKKGGDWVISASGGVQILPWEWVDQVEVSTNADGVRQQFAAAPSSFWAH